MPSFERKKRRGSKYKDKVTISISYPSADHITSPTMSTTSSNQASMVSSSCSKEPITLRHSHSTECHNIFKESSARRENSLNNLHKKAGKRTSSGVKVQVRKFRMETKAAKTLAIIVGKCLAFRILNNPYPPLKHIVVDLTLLLLHFTWPSYFGTNVRENEEKVFSEALLNSKAVNFKDWNVSAGRITL